MHFRISVFPHSQIATLQHSGFTQCPRHNGGLEPSAQYSVPEDARAQGGLTGLILVWNRPGRRRQGHQLEMRQWKRMAYPDIDQCPWWEQSKWSFSWGMDHFFRVQKLPGSYYLPFELLARTVNLVYDILPNPYFHLQLNLVQEDGLSRY